MLAHSHISWTCRMPLAPLSTIGSTCAIWFLPAAEGPHRSAPEPASRRPAYSRSLSPPPQSGILIEINLAALGAVRKPSWDQRQHSKLIRDGFLSIPEPVSSRELGRKGHWLDIGRRRVCGPA